MKFEIYHQMGHNYKWNLESISNDNAGDGVIIGPRSIEREKVEALPLAIRRRAIFDPQFFVPAVAKGKLGTYDFFPNVAAGNFETGEFDADSDAVADACVRFQLQNEFRYVVVPTRYVTGTPSTFINDQERLFVIPFMRAIESSQRQRAALLQLTVNASMLKDADYCADLLNWITGLNGIEGIYLIVAADSDSKQIKDADLLVSALKFIAACRANEMEVVLGYLNTEAILFSIADPTIVTMGAYENTRSFNIRAFQESASPQQGPRPRLYCSKALQWIDRGYHGAIVRMFPDAGTFFDRNQYQALMFEPTFQWHFTKPPLYKHHFLVLAEQLRTLASVNGEARFGLVRSWLTSARGVHQRLADSGVILDSNNDGSHLSYWLTAANEFARERGWALQ